MTNKGKWQNRIIGYGEEAPDQLLANPKNFRVHPKGQQDALLGVIRQVGIVDDVLVSRNSGCVIDGHLRVALAISENQPTIPVKYLDLTEEEEALILATFDPLSAMATADKEQLDALLREVSTGDAAVQAMLADLAKGAGLYLDKPKDDPGAQIDKAAELQEKWGTATGQLWEMPSSSVPGKCHRLLCGDSTKAEDVARLMGKEKAVLLATDPPYGVKFKAAQYNPRAKEWDEIINDDRQGGDLLNWLASVWRTWLPHITEDFAFYCWTAAKTEQIAAAAAAAAAGIHIQSQIIWVKNVFVLGQADYQWGHENCLYGFFKGKQHRWFGGRDQRTTWNVDKVPNQQYQHPTQKPTGLFVIPMLNHTRPSEICGEPFSGSGSQLVAGEQEGRLVYACELEPKYIAVALERLAGMGLEPKLAEGGSSPTVALQEVN